MTTVSRSLTTPFPLPSTCSQLLDLVIADDLVRAIVARVPIHDLLPVALTCMRMWTACIERAKANQKQDGPLWTTLIVASASRVKWALGMGNIEPSEAWCKETAERGDLAMLQWLRVHLEPPCPWSETGCMSVAAAQGHLSVVQWLHEQGVPLPDACLATHFSAMHGHLAMVQWLHEQGAPLFVTDNFGNQPIHCAALHGHLAVVQWLHEQGMPLTVAGYQGRQPIHCAARRGHLAVVQWLHKQGVSLVVADSNGDQPIHHAALRGHLDTVQWLHEQGVPLPA